ncbi:hypothetical protein B566_EDAN005319 [Ephemera danica]|nr:hypothetical protein B566_EDAN005319 [Ephemera danica]
MADEGTTTSEAASEFAVPSPLNNDKVKCENNDCSNVLQEEIIDSVVTSKATFKNEQIGDPELTMSTKREIASKILQEKPGQFLAKFGNYIPKKLLKYFETLKPQNYEVEFYLQQLQKKHEKGASKTQIKNRRYAALKKLVNDGTYFSEIEMRRRNPLLYEHLIGQYLTDAEKNDLDHLDIGNITLLGLLLEHMDRDETRSLRLQQQMQEESVMEESDSDDEDEDMGHNKPPPDEEKNLLRQEFVSQMYQSFLEGKDADFDYTLVDNNTEYDSLEVQQLDAEDSYFDSETPEQLALSTPDSPSVQRQNSEEVDELDAYMQTLPETTQQIDWPQATSNGRRKKR